MAGVLALLILTALGVNVIPYAEIPSRLQSAPPRVRILAAALPGKPWWMMRLTLHLKFGRPDRDIGSGVYIEEWDLPEGTVRLHSSCGPTFADKASGQVMPLLKSSNPLGSCIFRGYGMRFGPHKFYGDQLNLNPDLSYRHNGHVLVPPGKTKPECFLLKHPAGRFVIHYLNGASAGTILEDTPDGSIVAALEFIAADGQGGFHCKVIADRNERGLRLIPDETIPSFTGWTSWRDLGIDWH